MSYYDDASLVLIPSGVKAAKVYSQKPINGTGDLTFARASTATRTNASGVIESVASNVPRLDYSGGATCPRLLLEPQRTNLVFPSDTATTQTRTVTATAHTLSFYGTGSVTLSGVATGTLNGTGDNNRVALTFTPTAGSLTLTVSGTVTNWQLEVGAYATTYIPTTTAAVTRLADAAGKTGVSSLIGQTEGTLFVELNLEYLNFTQYRNCISVTDGTFNNAAIIFINNSGGNSNQFVFNVRNGGLTVASITASNLSIANIGSTYKIAAAYKANDFVFYVNGVQIGADTSGSISGTLSRIDLGSIGFTGLSTTDRQSVNQAALFPTRLTNAQLAQLTTL